MVIKTYKYRLYPTEAQTKCLEKTFGLCRFLYNSALEERISYYKNIIKVFPILVNVAFFRK